MPGARIPLATYRLQLNRGFRFADARRLVPYLRDLGVSDLYSSPIVAARKGSTHGYDVVDPARLNPELGPKKDFDALSRDLRKQGMGLLLDIVPNHMAASVENPWWRDVLEHGRASAWAGWFDIDWKPGRPGLDGRVMLPVLADRFETTLTAGRLKLALGPDGFTVRCDGTSLPLRVGSWGVILSALIDDLERDLGPGHAAVERIRELAGRCERAEAARPARGSARAEAVRREREAIREAIVRLRRESADVREFLSRTLDHFNGSEGDRASLEPLDELLKEQHYRLAWWRRASEEINYRRFFNITDLVSLRIEDPRVFQARHDLVLRLCAEGSIQGFRVDHVDGLLDPEGYLRRLRGRAGAGRYLVVEKILAEGERLPSGWPVAGTTGYEFLNAVNELFVDPRGVVVLDGITRRFTEDGTAFEDLVREKKKMIIERHFPGEMRSLGRQLARLAARDPRARRLLPVELERALMETTACLPVYRTYIRGPEASPEDRKVLTEAIREARRLNPAVRRAAFEALQRVLLPEAEAEDAAEAGRGSAAERRERLEFVMRWQQFTGPVMAKGVEDTALYVYNRLVSLNEVGGKPASTGVAAWQFHRAIRARGMSAPHTLNATMTHDAKRGEDVRARISVLSELPRPWEESLVRWRALNAPARSVLNGRPVPGPWQELLIYQMLLGAWPLSEGERASFAARMKEYVVKAAREAKAHTSWIEPDERYEAALVGFVEGVLNGAARSRFLADFTRLQKRIARAGMVNGLSQVILKAAAPGVPDFYQGSELWDLRLVDPDNRRPVDFAARVRMLARLKTRAAREGKALPGRLLARWRDGAIKMYVTWKALDLRREHPELFGKGAYLPVAIEGRRQENVCAFARKLETSWVIAAVPRFVANLLPDSAPPVGAKVWSGTSLLLPAGAPARWENALTGETLQTEPAGRRRTLDLARVFSRLPVALLSGERTKESPPAARPAREPAARPAKGKGRTRPGAKRPAKKRPAKNRPAKKR